MISHSVIRKARRPQAAGYKVDEGTVQSIAQAWRAVSILLVDHEVLIHIKEALQRRDINMAMRALPDIKEMSPVKLRQLLNVINKRLAYTYEMSANREYARVGSLIRTVLKAARGNRFVEVPHSKEFIEKRSAQLVVDITREQRENLRQVIADRYDPNLRPDVLVRQIKTVVGLTAREVKAVSNLEDRLDEENELSERQIQSRVQAYAERLHQARAERIARTETVSIETAAREDAWLTARDEGLIPEEAGKQWVTSSHGTCGACGALDGEIVGLNESFMTSNGPIKGSPLHPNCVCMTELVIMGK